MLPPGALNFGKFQFPSPRAPQDVYLQKETQTCSPRRIDTTATLKSNAQSTAEAVGAGIYIAMKLFLSRGFHLHCEEWREVAASHLSRIDRSKCIYMRILPERRCDLSRQFPTGKRFLGIQRQCFTLLEPR